MARNSESLAEERIKLFELIRDASAPVSSGGVRPASNSYGDNRERIRLDLLEFAGTRCLYQGFDDLVTDCLDDYDLWRFIAWTCGEDSRR